MIARPTPLVRTFLAVLALAPLAPAAEPAPAPRPIRPRFDLTYLPSVGHQGLLGLRPAEIVRDMPELGLQTRTVLDLISDRLPDVNLTAGDPPALAEIDQCVMTLQFHIKPDSGGEHGSVYLGFSTPVVVRTSRPFDWDGLMRKWFPKAVPTRHAGRSYIRVRLDPLPEESAFGLFCPDGRTLVIAAEDAVRGLIDRLAKNAPAPVPPPGWGEVDRYPVALTLDNRTEKVIQGKMAKNKPGHDETQALADSFACLSVGVSAGAGTTFKLSVTSADGRRAQTAAHNIRRLLELAVEPASETIEQEMAADAVKNLALERNGRRLSGSTSIRRNLFKTFATWIHGPD